MPFLSPAVPCDCRSREPRTLRHVRLGVTSCPTAITAVASLNVDPGAACLERLVVEGRPRIVVRIVIRRDTPRRSDWDRYGRAVQRDTSPVCGTITDRATTVREQMVDVLLIDVDVRVQRRAYGVIVSRARPFGTMRFRASTSTNGPPPALAAVLVLLLNPACRRLPALAGGGHAHGCPR